MLEIVVNPAGASGQAARLFQRIEPLFQNVPYNVHYSTKNRGIAEIVHTLTSRGMETDLVIIGGDGTLNQAVNGIADFLKTRIGFIPCGSGNDFARALAYPKNPEIIVNAILQGVTKRTIDVGEVIYYNTSQALVQEVSGEDHLIHHRFLISCGIGFDAESCQKAQTSKWKKVLNLFHLGKLIYLFIAIGLIMHHQTFSAAISINRKKETFEKMLFAVCMNEPYEGGGFMFCPHADDTDHQLDVCIGNHLSRRAFFRIFPYAYHGHHLKFPGITERRGEIIEIKTNQPLWVHTDGEVCAMSSHIIVKMDCHQVRFLF